MKVGLTKRDWKLALSRLAEINLLAVQADGSVDCHPLLRGYFGGRLRQEQPEAWRIAHRRLYEHLCAITKDKPQPTLEDLQPLYQAVAHGCQAGLQQEACAKVYRERIQRGEEAYSTTQLGAFGSDLGAIASFFEQPWSRVSTTLSEFWRAWLLNQVALRLRALGRLTEAIEPNRAGLEMLVKLEAWLQAAQSAANLNELELTLGEVAGAVGDAEQSVTYADRSGDADWKNYIHTRKAHADALHQAGRRAEAEARFRQAEEMQAKIQPDHPLLYSLQGFQYCDLLLTESERAAWQHCYTLNSRPSTLNTLESCRTVEQRAAQTHQWAKQHLAACRT